MAARLDGRTTSGYGYNLEQALLVSPTIFPVIFAALMGRFFKHIGLHLAERGTTLGRLEQFIGCQSLFSALERQIALHSWSVMGLALVVVWLLSPLGGQSALRILTSDTRVESSAGTYNYLSPLASQDSVLTGASSISSGKAIFTSLFLASLVSSSKYQYTPMDLWGNVKIPLYSSIANGSPGEMRIIPTGNGTNTTYASLIGIPVAGVRPFGHSNYSLRARQWDITCSSHGELSAADAQFGGLNSTWKMSNAIERCTKYPCPISVKSLGADDTRGNVTITNCQVSYEYYETSVSCTGMQCQADAMRKLDFISDGYTLEMDALIRFRIFQTMLDTLPSVDTVGVVGQGTKGSTYTERWLVDPSNFMGAQDQFVDLNGVPLDVLSQRLTIIFNTFFQTTYATTALGGNLPNNLSSLASLRQPNLVFNNTQARLMDDPYRVYKTRWSWFTALLVSSIILQVAAYVGLILKYITLAPDIIGYASSLTLLNPYTPTPTGGTTLHGLERTALLSDLPVRIGDVCPNEKVGAIALARSDLGLVGKLDRKKIYI